MVQQRMQKLKMKFKLSKQSHKQGPHEYTYSLIILYQPQSIQKALEIETSPIRRTNYGKNGKSLSRK